MLVNVIVSFSLLLFVNHPASLGGTDIIIPSSSTYASVGYSVEILLRSINKFAITAIRFSESFYTTKSRMYTCCCKHDSLQLIIHQLMMSTAGFIVES